MDLVIIAMHMALYCAFFSDMLVCLDILTAAELNKSLVIKEKGFYHIGKIRKYGLTS